MLQPVLHYGIHFAVPLIIAIVFFKSRWMFAYFIMAATMLIDLDHILATPIFNPERCSINFHPLHTYPVIGLYVFFLFPKKTRLIGLGLVIHIIADWVDCLLM